MLSKLISFIISIQIVCANQTVVSRHQFLKRLEWQITNDLHHSVLVGMNKFFTNPQSTPDYIDRSLNFSKEDRELFLKHLAQVDKTLLRKAKIEIKKDQHIITFPQGRTFVFDLRNIARGYITLNGEKFLIKNFNSYKKIQAFVYKNYVSKKKDFSLLNVIIPTAYAIVPIALISIVVVTIIGIGLLYLKQKSIYSKYANPLKEATEECKGDLKKLSKKRNRPEAISNNTLVFIKQMKDLSNAAKLQLKEHTKEGYLSCWDENDCRYTGQNLLSYKNIKHIDSYFADSSTWLKDVRTLASKLEKCLNEVKLLVKSKGLNINDSARYMEDTAYDKVFGTFSEGVLHPSGR